MLNLLSLIKKQNPLITLITNYVTINDCANAVLAVGASPVMSFNEEDSKDLLQKTSVLVINMGTLSNLQGELIFKVAKMAKNNSVPIIFDPVGVGASEFRYNFALNFLNEFQPEVICGNKSEILALNNYKAKQKGVDSQSDNITLETKAAILLAKKYSSVIVATGETDILTNGQTVYKVYNGHVMLNSITGTGCMLTAIMAAFMALKDDSNLLIKLLHATILMGLAGEKAKKDLNNNNYIGTFKVKLFDYLSSLTDKDLEKLGKYNEENVN